MAMAMAMAKFAQRRTEKNRQTGVIDLLLLLLLLSLFLGLIHFISLFALHYFSRFFISLSSVSLYFLSRRLPLPTAQVRSNPVKSSQINKTVSGSKQLSHL